MGAERIARVVVDVALDREFDYLVPGDLAGRVHVGSRVEVPFGRRRATGTVVAWRDGSAIERSRLKAVLEPADDRAMLSEALLGLARWMAAYYCAPIEHAIRTLLPGAVRRRGAGPRSLRFIEPVAPDAEADGPALTARQREVLELVRTRDGEFLHVVRNELGCSEAPILALKRHGAVRIVSRAVARDPLARKEILPTSPLPLMPEQQDALALILQTMERARPGAADRRGGDPHVVLLYGVTGSGKTEVYLQAIETARAAGKGAIVLVPEIALTPQTVERFAGRFGRRIAVLHSHLSEGERHDEWHRIRDGEADIVVGARSAVFAPVRNLGLIVVDEEHEPSYKQEEAPRYHARDVAVVRGRLEGCAVVLGSATPSLESWSNVRGGKYALARLTVRADHRTLPVMRVVDMRVKGLEADRHFVLSRDLMEAIRRRLERSEQTMLFLNRRGYATSLICPQCGYVANCDACSVAYTFHRPDGRLHCHICGARTAVPPACPGCGDPAFRYAGLGTQRVENIVARCFPQARIQRMDADVTTARDAYERILGDFRVGKTDILIGTQMIAKGLHFPNVTLVGVIYADLSLHMPDFRAGERTFQLLAQVAGRAGRGDVAGEVIVQTYTPFQPAIQAARRVDYEGFADQELAFREELGYPPYTRLACVHVRGRSEAKAAYYAECVARALRERLGASIRGGEAAPAPLARAKGQYRFQIILRTKAVRVMSETLRAVTRELPPPPGIHAAVDIDAVSLL